MAFLSLPVHVFHLPFEILRAGVLETESAGDDAVLPADRRGSVAEVLELDRLFDDLRPVPSDVLRYGADID
jgi:hypothetical protein